MGVIADVTDRVAVLYRGKLVQNRGLPSRYSGNGPTPTRAASLPPCRAPAINCGASPPYTYIE